MHEKQVSIKRTIWTWECCGDRQEFIEPPPFKERQCPSCKSWVAPEQHHYVGPEINEYSRD